MREKQIRLDPWKWEGVVFVGGTTEQYATQVERLTGSRPSIGAHSAGHCYVEYGKPWALWVQSLADVASLAHEALHTAAGVLEGRGVKYSADSEEAYTYTMEHIIRAALDSRGWRAVR